MDDLGVLSASLSAKRMNNRVKWAVERYKTRLQRNIHAAYAEGFIVGTEPPKTTVDALAQASARMPMVMDVMQRQDSPGVFSFPEPMREQATKEYQAWLKMRRTAYEQPPTG